MAVLVGGEEGGERKSVWESYMVARRKKEKQTFKHHDGNTVMGIVKRVDTKISANWCELVFQAREKIDPQPPTCLPSTGQ